METLWFWLVGFMLATYVVLDGFDLGAGVLHLFVARTEEERGQVLRTIGPVWDGNEVWLLASLLTTTRAIAIHAGVFIALGGIQIAATALITLCATRYKDTSCPIHLPAQPGHARGPCSDFQATYLKETT